MPLPRIKEVDEDIDSNHPPSVVRSATPASNEGFPSDLDSPHGNGGFQQESADDFFVTEPGLNALQAMDFAIGARLTPVTRSLSTLSTFSNASVLSIRSSGRTFSLKDFCEQVIDKHLWLQTARIVSTSCYSELIKLVLHRFLIFQLRRPEKKDIWLRIDRRAGISFFSLARKLGKTRAHDVVQLSGSKRVLTGRARRENIQNFERPPFLGDFGLYLSIICEELLEYKVWPENCWMLCSLLQEHLEASGGGHYTLGGPVARSTAPDVRGRISQRVVTHVTPTTIMTALRDSAWTFSPLWQPLSFSMPRGWLAHSIGTFLAKIAYPSQSSDTYYRSQGALEWITGSSLPTRLEWSDMHSRIALYCIDILGRLPEGNVLRLPNPLILNSHIPDLALQIQSKIPKEVQYAALYGLLHVAEIGNPRAELFNQLETFFAASMIRWLELLSLLGATKNAQIALEKVSIWYESQTRRLQDQNRNKSLLQLLLRCRRFTYQYHEVISASAGHITHSALSHSSYLDWQRQYGKSSQEQFPTIQGEDFGWDGCLHTFRGHTGYGSSASFSPDGYRIASASDGKTILIWDTVTGDELKDLRGHSASITSVSFSPDGFRLASTSKDNTIRIWDPVTGEALNVLQGHASSVASVSFSPNGFRVASASHDNTVRIWDAVAGELRDILEGHTDCVNSVSFSSDGSRVASASNDNTVRIWDAGTGEELKVLQGHTDWVNSVSFSPDEPMVASASGDKTVRIWDVVVGKELKILRGHKDRIFSVSFSPDGSRVASAAYDVRIWDVVTGEELKVLGGNHYGFVSVTFSPDGSRVASAEGHDHYVRIWDAVVWEDLKVLRKHAHRVNSFSFTPDGTRLASASYDNTVRIWDAVTGEDLKVLRGHTYGVASVSFSPDGSKLASASSDCTVRIWDVGNGDELKVLRGHTHGAPSVSFSPDGSRLASASYDNTVRLWDAVTGKELQVLQGHTKWVLSVSFSPDGSRLVSASNDNTVRIWDAMTGKEFKVIRGIADWVRSVSFSPDGFRVALALHDNTTRIWDAVTGEAVSTGSNSVPSYIYRDPGPDMVTVPNACSFAEVEYDELNHIHLFIGECGIPHFIAPAYISDNISTWKASRDFQAIAIGTLNGSVLIIHAPNQCMNSEAKT
ncbi:WD40-repeat-containing domain protein [Cantharellus anzutake]|uniref:WD40-repeat-containing domain protein n=1 Tax=Cantharellus anzutake TaxID=1750568 RepID=UPI00190503AA|nr:WD40-repeat-containing domain protein [Cantharellus anzutake]KAF8327463.1 WD40-repeat-containing domain protein [Cantharellus anzutake]